MKTRVLDSWAILEWIGGRQPATGAVAELAEAEAGAARLFMSAINVGEVYYFLRKNHREELAASWRESSRTLPIAIEVPAEIPSFARLQIWSWTGSGAQPNSHT